MCPGTSAGWHQRRSIRATQKHNTMGSVSPWKTDESEYSEIFRIILNIQNYSDSSVFQGDTLPVRHPMVVPTPSKMAAHSAGPFVVVVVVVVVVVPFGLKFWAGQMGRHFGIQSGLKNWHIFWNVRNKMTSSFQTDYENIFWKKSDFLLQRPYWEGSDSSLKSQNRVHHYCSYDDSSQNQIKFNLSPSIFFQNKPRADFHHDKPKFIFSPKWFSILDTPHLKF